MSASTHWLASSAAQSVLERGGNAFDAAVAGAFVLQVVEPHLNGPGGDMTGVFATAEEPDRPQIMMGQGPAPAGATIDHYTGLGLELVPGAGALAAAIPAATDAWLKLLEDHGSWEIADVLDFAIDLAENGHPIVPRVARTIGLVEDLFTEHWPSSRELWMPDGQVPRPQQVLTNPDWAGVLRRLVTAGEEAAGAPEAAPGARAERVAAAREEWRTGVVAQAVDPFVRTPHRHSDGGDYAGVITARDFAGFQADFEDAVTIDFRGYTIAKTGAWGQGPVLLQALKILDGFEDERLDPGTEIGVHTILEALKLALADRDTYYGDDHVDLDVLLSEEYAAERRALIGEEASLEFRPGRLASVPNPVLPPLMTELPAGAATPEVLSRMGLGEPTVAKPGQEAEEDRAGGAEGQGASGAEDGQEVTGPDGRVNGDTCHIDVVDRWGNMVSATPSGGWLQSSPTIPGLGFCLGTRLQMNWLDKDSPSHLEPGNRPRTTLTPTLVLKDGQPVMAIGTPGGDQQDQWQLVALLRILVGGYEPQQAIDAPSLHTTSMPGSFWPRTWTPGGAVVEDRLGEDVIGGLERRGHVVTRAGDWALGRLSCVVRDPETGLLQAAANPRGNQGYATGR
ncbi:gamma-glutamyltransferase family protein [Brevibacterium litoralis]|uniref:gamma-glutamyltransferase family protein n=1 Tax=Brevibacterium litoralis TaxID=3138935 RepID=UPI0032EC9184